MRPGITVRPFASITLVFASASLRMSALLPVATMRWFLIASACAMVKRSSTVMILPLSKIVSTAPTQGENKKLNKNKYLQDRKSVV